MPAGINVRPKIWTDVEDLYDDGEYSAIWGHYKGNIQPCLGVRWNEGENPRIGYPSLFGHPQWYIEPEFTTKCVLNELLIKLHKNPSLPRYTEYKDNIMQALQTALSNTTTTEPIV